jgi:bifunctional non-homologous end joining protein LigD
MHRVRPELVADVKFLTWTDDNLLRQVAYKRLREDKPAAEVRRLPPFVEMPASGRVPPKADKKTRYLSRADVA